MDRRRLLPTYHYEDAIVLPKEYQRVEYIESTGTQYIDTGTKLAEQHKFFFDFMPDTTSGSNSFLGGARTSSTTGNWADAFYVAGASSPSKNRVACAYGTENVYITPVNSVLSNTRHILEFEHTSTGALTKLDGVQTYTGNSSTINTTLNYYLFLVNEGNTASITRVYNGRIYSVKIWNNDALTRNFIPCYEKTGQKRIGMYDLVENKFYTNQGTGTFNKGADIPTLQKSVEKNLRDYKIYGESVQNGTPSPDNPIEIQSVGDKTVNLSPFSEYTNTSANYYLNSPELYDLIKNKLEVGTYTSSGNYKYKSDRTSGSAANIRILSGSSGIATLLSSNSTGEYTTRTIEITQEIKDQMTAVYIYFGIGDATDSYIKNFQIEKGSSATSYEPYGYRIPVEVKGKNLFDKDHADIFGGYLTLNSPVKPFTSESAVSVVLRINPNTTYTVSKLADTKFRIATFTEYPTSSTVATVWDTTHNTASSLTITSGASDIYMMVFYFDSTTANSESVLRGSIQIEEGSTATQFEPYFNKTTNIYLDEPLRKIGDYADYIDFKNKKVVRNIKEGIINLRGTVYVDRNKYWFWWSKPNDSHDNGFYISNLMSSVGEKSNSLPVFISGDGNVHNYAVVYNDTLITVPTIEELRTKVDGKRYIYKLATPTEETIDLPNIPTPKGNGIIIVDTLIQPSQANWQYYRSK